MITSAQIRAARAMINAKQIDLANAAGISLATLNNIERGVADPRASTLDAIERALFSAGIECDSDGGADIVRLNARIRPSGRETLQASQRILALLDRGSLLRPEHILFFVHRTSSPTDEEGQLVLGMMISGAARTVLLDQLALSLKDNSGLAEIAGIVLASMALYRDTLHFCPVPITSTISMPTDHAIARLGAEVSETLKHPRPLFDMLGGWDDSVTRAGTRFGHPMRDLLGFLGEEVGTDEVLMDDASGPGVDTIEIEVEEAGTDFVIVMDDSGSDETEETSS